MHNLFARIFRGRSSEIVTSSTCSLLTTQVQYWRERADYWERKAHAKGAACTGYAALLQEKQAEIDWLEALVKRMREVPVIRAVETALDYEPSPVRGGMEVEA